MSVKIEKTDNKNELKLEFTVDSKIFEDGIATVFKKNAKYFSVPGFRKGKVPMHIAEKHYGTEIFYEDAFNEVVPAIYEKEINDNNLDVVSRPQIDIVQMEKGKDLIFTAIVQTKPDVELGTYKGIQLEKIEYKVKDEDVEKELKHMAEKNVRIVTVEDRAAKEGDIAVIDFDGSIDGVPFDGGKAENHELELGSHSFIEGFEDQVVGMKVDEEKDINVTFPEEYFSKELAGKPAVFKVKLHEIKAKEYPEMDDEFAKDVSEFDTIAELKADIKKNLEEQNEHKAKHETEDKAIEKVCDNSKVDIPSGMIESELDAMSDDLDRRLAYQGMNLDQYLKIMNKTKETFREEMKPQAETSIKTRLVLEAISKDAKIVITEEEMKEKIAELAKTYGRPEEELQKNEEFKKYITSSLETEKAVKYIIDNAKIK